MSSLPLGAPCVSIGSVRGTACRREVREREVDRSERAANSCSSGSSRRPKGDYFASASKNAAEKALEAEAELAEAVRRTSTALDAVDPRLRKAAPDEMKTLEPARVTPALTRAGFAVDAASDANMRALTKSSEGGLPIVVAIRSRADETLEWLNTQLGIVLKPFNIKQKNVWPQEAQFLGYRAGAGYPSGDVGSVVLAAPISEAQLATNLLNAPDHLKTVMRERWEKRWKEWYGAKWPSETPDPGTISKRQELFDHTIVEKTLPDGTVVREGFIPYPEKGSVRAPGDNLDTSGAAVRMTERKFELRKVSDPPDGAGGIDPDREYWEVWVEDADGQMKRVGGDLDVVGVTDHAGATLASEAAENVALQLQDAIDAQHPWTTTWNNPEGRAEMLAAHKWDRDPSKRGEPLLVYVEGEAYIAWFDPDLSVSTDNPFDALLWLHGGPNPLGAVEDATQFQRDLRSKLVDPTDITPPHFIPAELQVKIALNKIKAKLAGVIAKIERNKGAKLYKFVGDVLSTWSETEGWQPVVTLPDIWSLLPETGLTRDVVAGDSVLPIFEPAELGLDPAMFQVGDLVMIGAGTDHEEFGVIADFGSIVIADFGSIVLAQPLQFDHAAGESVVVVRFAEESGGTIPATGGAAKRWSVLATWLISMGVVLALLGRRRRQL